MARSPYFCTVDADCVIEKDALLRLMHPVIRSPLNTVLSAGIVRILNGCRMREGQVVKIDLPRRAVEKFQVVEYLRSFLFGRPGWNLLNATFIAYQDPRFLQKFDSAYGYRTRSVLCMPIRNKTGEIIGVIQLLNKIQGTFGVEDEEFLQSLTVHVAIALENAQLHAELVDQQRIRTELALARQIQQNLLPRPPERWHRYRVAALAETCFEVGGDFYDFLTVSPTTMAAVIADVSGKGVSSALVMSTMQATLRAMMVGVHSFERLLVKMNEVIHDYTNGRMFVTLFLALLNSESNKLHYINAGHNPPILIHKDGGCEQLEEGGTVLGLLPSVSYTRAQTDLLPGDVLLLYTDGLVEATNAADEMFGIEGLVDSVRASPDGSPEATIVSIVSRVREFTGGAPQSDDQTLVVISPDS